MDTQDLNAPALADGAKPAAPAPAAPEPYPTPDVEQFSAFVQKLVTDGIRTAFDNLAKPSAIPAAELQTLVADVKPFWQSKTLITLAASGIVALGGVVGVTADPKDAVVTAVATLAVAGVTSLFGAVFHALSTKKPV